MTKQKQQAQGSLDNLKPLMEERAMLTTSLKRIEARIKELDAELRPSLVGRGELIHSGYSFKVDTVAGRKTIDTKAMERDHGSDFLKPYEKIGAPSTRFVVKPVQEI